MKGINQSYIRGFFDGEGHCGGKKRKVVILTNYNKGIMQEINKTLTSLGIENKLYKPNNQQAYKIGIHGYYNLSLFYEKIGTNHDIKNQQFIEMLTSYNQKFKRLSKEQGKRIVSLKTIGMTCRRIASIVGCSAPTVHERYKEHLRTKGIGSVKFLRKILC